MLDTFYRHPTMKKWTQKELLCNSRGLDDGYVFLHKDHPLSKETLFVLKSKDGEYTKDKFCLADKDVSKSSCFFGFIRKPLSNEIYDLDEDSTVPLPASSSKISRVSEVFSDPLEPNETICFAFTEPSITSHRSEILPGANLPASVLNDDDRRIRRPRLNRGGDTIANLGGNNKSHKSGYGSMNISSYERNLAIQNGRGRQMNQAGTRSWGSAEPTPKRFNAGGNQYSVPPPQQMNRWQPPPAQNFQQPPNFPPPPPPQWQPPPAPQQQYQYNQQGYQQPQQQYNAGAYNQQSMQAMTGYNPQQQQWRGQPQQHIRFNQVQQQTNQQRQGGFSFNQQGQQRQHQAQPNYSHRQQQQRQPPPQQQPQTGGRANLTNLRAQLMSTLKKNKGGGN